MERTQAIRGKQSIPLPRTDDHASCQEELSFFPSVSSDIMMSSDDFRRRRSHSVCFFLQFNVNIIHRLMFYTYSGYI